MGQLMIDVEGSYAFQDYNEVQVPKPSGTLFDLNRDFQLQQPAIAPRLRLTYSFGKNNISALFAPLTTTYEGISPKDIRFEGVQFFEGEYIYGKYTFNSYRLTYRRDLIDTDNWLFGIGFTAKIRDAEIALDTEDAYSTKTNVGFVPLVRLVGAYKLNNWKFFIEGDGLFGGPGRAFDAFGGASYKATIGDGQPIHLKAGYRIIEGGADVAEVYNFTAFHLISVGAILPLDWKK
tara:strand:- start:61248 stop:61949 length:702 start_codon:yes stop_codon:yes gene_type:complete